MSEAREQAWATVVARSGIRSADEVELRYPNYRRLRVLLNPGMRLFLRLRMQGLHHVPRRGPVILAANHLSHVDPIMVIMATRRKAHYLAKDGHFVSGPRKWLMNATGQIETHRESGARSALSSAVALLGAGKAVGIFPEGTRSKRTESPYLLEGKTGVARLAATVPHATVIPVALKGTRGMMQPSAHKFPRLWRRVEITIGRGITWEEWLVHPDGAALSDDAVVAMAEMEDDDLDQKMAVLQRQFTDQLMASLKHLGAP
ncbi:MAG: 1-acyl-sn-glycerol-3-phosphate acyltransferase [Candidatus Poseidoniaceae archaeon]|nr:1-acyl-sn-glycerol-3-phosphate acyltransferase [Candidatus Poseidoniaceae archaeon]